MKLRIAYDAFKFALAGMLCLLLAGFFFAVLTQASAASRLARTAADMPNYDYTPDIRQLKAEGRLSEAVEMARFVIRHPDMPGQDAAKELEKELSQELTSMWGRTKRAASGFVKGSGNSIEELSGGIASDMIIYGDVRDLIKQGYYKVTGKDTDSVIAALAGMGLLTEAVDAVDWAPAVLKAFRKVGSLSREFADTVISACKKSAKARMMDETLRGIFANVKVMTDKLGLARAAAVFKHVETPADLQAVANVCEANADTVYLMVKNGGEQGITVIKSLGEAEVGAAAMSIAAKKGPLGVAWLSHGGKGHTCVRRTRACARFLKNLHLGRPQRFVVELAKRSPGLRKMLWASTVITAVCGVIGLIKAGVKTGGLFRKEPMR